MKPSTIVCELVFLASFLILLTDALQCITCRYDAVLTLDGDEYIGDIQPIGSPDCLDKPKNFKSETCADVEDSMTRCSMGRNIVTQAKEDGVYEFLSINRACIPMPNAIDPGDGELLISEIQAILDYDGPKGTIQPNSYMYACSTDDCNSGSFPSEQTSAAPLLPDKTPSEQPSAEPLLPGETPAEMTSLNVTASSSSLTTNSDGSTGSAHSFKSLRFLTYSIAAVLVFVLKF